MLQQLAGREPAPVEHAAVGREHPVGVEIGADRV